MNRHGGTCVMLGDGEMLENAHHRHHNNAQPQLLHNLQQVQGGLHHCRVCGRRRRGIEAKQPGQLEGGQPRLNLQRLIW